MFLFFVYFRGASHLLLTLRLALGILRFGRRLCALTAGCGGGGVGCSLCEAVLVHHKSYDTTTSTYCCMYVIGIMYVLCVPSASFHNDAREICSDDDVDAGIIILRSQQH